MLNTNAEVDDVTVTRGREVIAELGYVPSSRAVGLARGNSRTVGMLVPSLAWPWRGEVLQGAADTVEAAGYGLLLFTCNRGGESVQRFTGQVSTRAFDGLLVVEPENTLGAIIAIIAMRRRGLPAFLIDDRGCHPEFPSVVTTNHEGGVSAARHLLSAGRRRPLVITEPLRFGCARDRLAGFRSACAEHGIELASDVVVEGDFTEHSGHHAVQQLLRRSVGFDAVFAHNDLSAAGALRALRAAGRPAPDDVAVVGFDDIPMDRHTDPALTTVRQPMRQTGGTAARVLLGHLAGVAAPNQPAAPHTELVVRSSAPGP